MKKKLIMCYDVQISDDPPGKESTNREILQILSESISQRVGKTVILKDIMEYEQYRRPVSDYKPEDIIGRVNSSCC